jgi:hypothetical protein
VDADEYILKQVQRIFVLSLIWYKWFSMLVSIPIWSLLPQILQDVHIFQIGNQSIGIISVGANSVRYKTPPQKLHFNTVSKSIKLK